MREVTIQLFPVNELSPKAKAKALAWGKKYQSGLNDSSTYTEIFKDRAADMFGVKTDDCYWSLSCCQGDGVAFYGKLDLEVLSKKHVEVQKMLSELEEVEHEISVNVHGKNGRYHHWNTMGVETDLSDCTGSYGSDLNSIKEKVDAGTKAYEISQKLGEFVKTLLKQASQNIEKFGYACIESDTSDKAIEELLIANEIEFDKNGEHVDL